jgi:hypothetical protein
MRSRFAVPRMIVLYGVPVARRYAGVVAGEFRSATGYPEQCFEREWRAGARGLFEPADARNRSATENADQLSVTS